MAAWITTAFILGACVGVGGMWLGARGKSDVSVTDHLLDLMKVMMLPVEPVQKIEVTEEESAVATAAMGGVLGGAVPLDWTEQEPSAAWMSYNVRPDVARLAPGQPIPFLNEEQTNLWRDEWEQVGEVGQTFQEYVEDSVGEGAAWVEPRGFDDG